jgi:hypothetical protein
MALSNASQISSAALSCNCAALPALTEWRAAITAPKPPL